MSNYSSGYSPIANFLPDSVQYGKVAAQRVKDYNNQIYTAMVADGLVDKTEIEGKLRTDMAEEDAKVYKARGAAKGSALAWQGAAKGATGLGSGFAKHLGNSPFGATEGVNPHQVVNNFGDQLSGSGGNDFYVDTNGNIQASQW